VSYRPIIPMLIAGIMLAGCSSPGSASGGSQPSTAAPGTTVQAAGMGARAQSLHGYYLTKFITTVGNALPESSFCFQFKSSGTWSNNGSESFAGTYMLSQRQLFASAVWLPSPAVYLTVQGTIGDKRGSGHFIVSTGNGSISGGGTYTMKSAQNSSCS
jgi:hypothetical protein